MDEKTAELFEKMAELLDKVNALIRSSAAILRRDGQNHWLVPDSLKREIEAALRQAQSTDVGGEG